MQRNNLMIWGATLAIAIALGLGGGLVLASSQKTDSKPGVQANLKALNNGESYSEPPAAAPLYAGVNNPNRYQAIYGYRSTPETNQSSEANQQQLPFDIQTPQPPPTLTLPTGKGNGNGKGKGNNKTNLPTDSTTPSEGDSPTPPGEDPGNEPGDDPTPPTDEPTTPKLPKVPQLPGVPDNPRYPGLPIEPQ